MTGKDFTAWLDHMGFKDAQAARALGGMSRNSIKKYKDEAHPITSGWPVRRWPMAFHRGKRQRPPDR